MKLNSALVERTVTQFDADPIPDRHPAMPQLNQVFGEHTFFLDPNGLHIVEPGAPDADGAATGEVLRIAGWSDESRSSLAPQPPEPIGISIVLAADEPDKPA
jgi:hypothetical protein